MTVRRLAKRRPFSRQPILFIFPSTSLCKDCIPSLFIGERDDYGFSVFNKIMTEHLDTREKVGESLMQLHCRVPPSPPLLHGTQLQWNPVNTDTNGTCPSVRINGVSVLSGLSEKTLQTHVLSKKRP